jgi:acyl-CoA thioester hydrolase
VAGLTVYRTAIRPEWIDYNGHLRDAYYLVIVSLACDALMDRVGLDAAYRQRTGGTLYTVEMHIHYLREVKAEDEVLVNVRVLAVDHKRLHATFEVARAADTAVDAAAATVEALLLHVRQSSAGVSTAPFPPEVTGALEKLRAETAGLRAAGPASRQITLRRAPDPP